MWTFLLLVFLFVVCSLLLFSLPFLLLFAFGCLCYFCGAGCAE